MSKIFNIGIIGAGMIAEHHIVSLQKNSRVLITWIAATKPEKLEKVRAKHAIGKATTNYKDILADTDVDAVVICTPPNLHKKMFIEAVEAGKHILVEKPLAMSLEEIDEMIEMKEQHPEVKVLDCSARHSRLQPKYKKIRDIISDGKLGEVYFVHHNCVWRQSRAGIEYHPEAKWFLNKAISGGGPLFDWGVYDLSFHLGILGDAVELENVSSVLLKRDLDDVDAGTDIYDVEDHFVANMQLTNNIRFYWERSSNANMETNNETRIYGTRGGIKVSYCSWEGVEIEYFDVDNNAKGKSRKEIIKITESDGHDDALALTDHFVKVIAGEEEPEMTLELARKHLDIIFKCYKKGEE